MVPKPVAISINLTPRARELVEAIRSSTGVPTTTAMERYLEWLMAMPFNFQLAILNRNEQAQDELLLAWLRDHLASKNLEVTRDDSPDFSARMNAIVKELNFLHAMYLGTKGVAEESYARLRSLNKKA